MMRPLALVLTVFATIALLAQPIHDATPHGFIHEALAQTGGPSVTRFVLVNAETDRDIGPLTDGMTISPGSYNVRAETDPSRVGSVVFGLVGNARSNVENIPPYALAQDDSGNYKVWKPALGDHRITATAYTERAGAGTAGQSRTVRFSVREAATDPGPVAGETCPDGLHDSSRWHPPIHESGCFYRHEHGDPAPQWVRDAGYRVAFDHEGGFHGNTSAAENTRKHAAMKGHAFRTAAANSTDRNIDIYLRLHVASNVMDRSARFHSYETFARDPSGAVSHWQGWFDAGNPLNPKQRFAYDGTQEFPDSGIRPAIFILIQATYDRGGRNEGWFAFTSGWGPGFLWSIDNATTLAFEGEHLNQDMSTWRRTGALGGNRTVAIDWNRQRTETSPYGVPPFGRPFWATQFGQLVSGPDDARCRGRSEKDGISYDHICLEQIIQPSLPALGGPRNFDVRRFEVTGVGLPN